MDIQTMGAADLDALIESAAKRRALLEPAVPRERPQREIQITVNPAWATQSIELGALMQFRHPGLGWVSFVLSPQDRIQLAMGLLHQSLLAGPPAQPQQPSAIVGQSVH
jgi:hypothetical protein